MLHTGASWPPRCLILTDPMSSPRPDVPTVPRRCWDDRSSSRCFSPLSLSPFRCVSPRCILCPDHSSAMSLRCWGDAGLSRRFFGHGLAVLCQLSQNQPPAILLLRLLPPLPFVCPICASMWSWFMPLISPLLALSMSWYCLYLAWIDLMFG